MTSYSPLRLESKIGAGAKIPNDAAGRRSAEFNSPNYCSCVLHGNSHQPTANMEVHVFFTSSGLRFRLP